MSEVAAVGSATAVTIGKFDAIHLGHQALLAALIEVAEQNELQPVVFTFANHPNTVLSPEQIPLSVIGENQRLALLQDAGVESVITVDFDSEFAAMEPAAFFANYLVGRLRARYIIVGEGFRFGAGGSGSIDTLRELGDMHRVGVIEVPSVRVDGVTASTTNVRNALDAGDVKLAARLLGRNHETTGIIEHGLKIGRTIGFPTANMARDAEGYLPIDGVYAGWLHCEGERYPAALSVGINETFQAVPRLIEAHVLDRTDLDFYDKTVTLEYVDFIRPVAKFDGIESLVAQIYLDIEEVRAKLLL
ncbi:MAG: riboflavin biosynthesis protein RibF [Microbacteriaceae bacterium]